MVPSTLKEEPQLEPSNRYTLMNNPAGAAFKAITELASQVFDTPLVFFQFAHELDQGLESYYGLDETMLGNTSFRAQALLSTKIIVINDTTPDPRFAHHPLVTGKPHIRFYASAPLLTSEGHIVGALCIFDEKPRNNFDEKQQALLKSLASLVLAEFEVGLQTRALVQELTRQARHEAKLKEANYELQTILANTSDIIAVFDASLRYTYVNPPVENYVGLPAHFLKGKTNDELDVPLYLTTLWNEKLREVLKTRRASELEFKVTTDHGPLYFQTKIAPKLEHGETKQLITVTRDVTTLKHRQAQQERENLFDSQEELP